MFILNPAPAMRFKKNVTMIHKLYRISDGRKNSRIYCKNIRSVGAYEGLLFGENIFSRGLIPNIMITVTGIYFNRIIFRYSVKPLYFYHVAVITHVHIRKSYGYNPRIETCNAYYIFFKGYGRVDVYSLICKA